ncbi:HAD family hydrolase [uncultured Clostridium sp.]|uniref:HAD family hydrolase n=1 Tax=uncultured Clostridium sp. TaxID=59620 RepID=UPI00263A3197|nr:HAD family hydrolase [uncultured Clostridium sp.]
MNKLHFITDLDRTIIHAKNKGFKCVEYMGDREITYMTDESYNGFLELLKEEEFEFIPCTMRNIKQTLRVDFIKEYNPRVMICTNGAQIYINGELDLIWNEKIKSLIDFNEVEKQIDYIKGMNLIYQEVRNIEGFYVTVKCSTKEEAKVCFDVLKDKFKASINIMHIGVKVFIIDEKIDKIYAVDYLTNKFSIKNLYTAGDSAVDIEFTKRGKAVLPKHSSFRHESATVTSKEGIYSTEDLINYLKKELIYYKLTNR